MVREPLLIRSPKHWGYAELQFSRLRTIMSVEQCGNHLMQQAKLPQLRRAPGLLVTDNSVVRGWVSGGALRGWVAHNTTVEHIQGRKMTSDAHEDMWVDVMMMAMGDCLVLSSSGFSKVAVWMSNSTCFARMLTCQVNDESRFAGIQV
jgi:hypothetical protein